MRHWTGADAVRRALALAGSLSVVASLALIWTARAAYPRWVYVSEMGAGVETTAAMFQIALLALAVGALLVAVAGAGVRSGPRWLALWAPSWSLVASSLCFVVASQVTCTRGCPTPFDPAVTAADLVHTGIAVLGFAAACFAMLQLAMARGLRGVVALSLASCVSVAVITILGGMLSLLDTATDIGAMLEFIGATIAMLWLVALGIVLAVGAPVEDGEAAPTAAPVSADA